MKLLLYSANAPMPSATSFATREATCVARSDKKHIDRAFVRELTRTAVKEYDLAQVRVVVDPALEWGDAVRAIDGARTCCGQKSISVSVE